MNVVEFKSKAMVASEDMIKVIDQVKTMADSGDIDQLVIVGLTKDGGLFVENSGIDYLHEFIGLMEVAKTLPLTTEYEDLDDLG